MGLDLFAVHEEVPDEHEQTDQGIKSDDVCHQRLLCVVEVVTHNSYVKASEDSSKSL